MRDYHNDPKRYSPFVGTIVDFGGYTMSKSESRIFDLLVFALWLAQGAFTAYFLYVIIKGCFFA